MKRARTSALAGDVDGPAAIFADAAEAGHRTARILLAQMLAFQHRWDELIPHATAVLTTTWKGPGNAFWEDLCPALLRAASETGRWHEAKRAIDGSPDPKLAEQHRRLGRRLLDEVRKHGGIDCHFPDSPNQGSTQPCSGPSRRAAKADSTRRMHRSSVRSRGGTRSASNQVAPTPLIADRDLGPVITAERGRALLATPRDRRDR